VGDFVSELKFLVDAATAARIRDWARARLEPDPHGTGNWGDEYRTATIYFDTPEFDVFQRVGSYGRSKYRIRRYGDDERVFLERKMRRGDRLAKRRSAVALAQLDDLADNWFVRRLALRHLAPVCEVTYRRTARQRGEGGARLTIDEALVAGRSRQLAFGVDDRTPILTNRAVVEIKFRDHAPAVFRHLLEEFQLGPQRTSKYRIAVDTLGLAPVVHA
jgi:SPX domain protein involved in polyphosphate accumulation